MNSSASPSLLDRVRSRWRQLLLLTLAVNASLILIFISWFTPLPVYALDKLNLRPFFLPNILCDNCTHIDVGFLLKNEDVCKEDLFLLNIVISFHANVVSRNKIRSTWGGEKVYRGQKIKTVFAFGIHADANFNNQLVIEQKAHGDILQVNMHDDYKHLTEKTITMLKWVQTYCSNAKYLLKTDDDSFNHVYRIADYLILEKQTDFVGGYCFTVTPDRRVSSKYFVPPEVFPDAYYPTYCAGPGYILSQSAIDGILKVYPNVVYLPMEDVFIAGLCRVAAGIQYTNMPGMIVGEPQLTKCDLATWAKNTHNVVPERMVELWDRAMSADIKRDCVYSASKKSVLAVILAVIWCRIMYYVVKR